MSSHPTLRLLSAALAGLVAAGATPWQLASARADDAAKVVVLPFRVIQDQVGEGLAPKTTDIIADELHNRDEVILATYKAPAPAAAPAGAPAEGGAPATGAQAGLEQIEKGEGLVKHFKFKPGADALEAGIADYEAFPAQVDLKVLREAYTQLAMAKMRSGDNEGGLSALSDVVRLAPEQPLAAGYPPPFKRAFDMAKKKTLAGSRVSVVIRGEGNIELDGKDQGAAPSTVQNVLQGAHFLRVKRPDGSLWGLKLMVGEGENTVTIPAGDAKRAPVVAEAPKGAFGALAVNRIDDGLLAEVAAATKEAGADYAVFGGVYRTAEGVGCAAHLYSARARGEVALKAISFDTDFVSAGIEANKLAGELVAAIKKFPGPESLPAPVASAIGARVVAAADKPKVDKPAEDKKPIVIKRKPEGDEGPKVAVVEKPVENVKPPEKSGGDTEGGVRTLSHKSTMADPAGGLESSQGAEAHKKDHPDEGGSNWWIYGVVGGVAAAAVGGGVAGFLVYKNNHTPATGSASLTFQ